MNDRYLYRAKRIDNGEWVEGKLVWSCDADDDYKAIIIPTTDSNMFTRGGARGDLGFENWFRVDPSTICQCTGLKDKNRKLIWENDIIKHYNDTSHPDKYDKGIVRWNDFNIRFERYSTDMKGNVCMNRDCVYEAIGNIFDNLDLLEV